MAAGADTTLSIEALRERVGTELGVSGWRLVDQDMIVRFADVTEDRQFIHVDPARAAAETPFGGAIAHGFLTLSLLSTLAQEALPAIAGRVMGINYGFDRVRFLSPVRAGARVRGRFVLGGLTMRSSGEAMLRYQVSVDVEGSDKPALSADWITLAILA
jgi:acyl dehydratase